jgi:hypothetical protein
MSLSHRADQDTDLHSTGWAGESGTDFDKTSLRSGAGKPSRGLVERIGSALSRKSGEGEEQPRTRVVQNGEAATCKHGGIEQARDRGGGRRDRPTAAGESAHAGAVVPIDPC